MESEYFDFKFNQKPADDTFVLPTPEGFTAEEADAAALGLDAMGGGDEAPELKVAAGDDAPAFTLKDTAGTEVTLASLKGRVVLLDFWATWCGPCKAAMPSIQKIHEHFKDKPVSIIGVNTWEEKPTAAADYMKKKGFTYGCLLKGDDLATAYGISGIPTLVLIDANGKVLDISVGFDPAEEDALIKKIEAQLQAK
jgi:thiol-disulfide isomerase/thioredoxin